MTEQTAPPRPLIVAAAEVAVLPAPAAVAPPERMTMRELVASGWDYAYPDWAKEQADAVDVQVPGHGRLRYFWSDPDGGPDGFWHRH